ncbi:MAG: hypothetical protein KAU31_14045 [Spirochaetaceae bacterium]|nr:hypothetical protein [Spirochaetaceae bacterium]
MTKPKRIATLDNEIQARLLSALLDEEGITHLLRSYHDSAYDGLFQTERGWGHIEADEQDGERILALIAAMKKSESEQS